MLKLSGSLLNRPILSLRTGTVVATVGEPIINPNNLKIEGFYCIDSLKPKKQLVLLCSDIREIIAKGFVINDHEVLADIGELHRLQPIVDLGFVLIGKQVITASKDKIGKVSDYAIEDLTMYIQKIYVSQSVIRNLTGGSLSIDRNQIIEITSRRIIINDLLQGVRANAAATA